MEILGYIFAAWQLVSLFLIPCTFVLGVVLLVKLSRLSRQLRKEDE